MAEIVFYHPLVRITEKGLANNSAAIGSKSTSSVEYLEDSSEGSSLFIDIRPNEIYWDFNLNTQSYPTYAGEVVQILSANIGTFNIAGDIRTYRDMELIYRWFINYFYIATQGQLGAEEFSTTKKYDEIPVNFEYPHRDWNLQLRPISAPSFVYGTEVIVPSWKIEASVVEDENLNLTTFNNEYAPAAVKQELSQLHANFGTGLQNPFAYYHSPYEAAGIKQFLNNVQPIVSPNSEQLTNWYHKLIGNLARGEVNLNEYAIPVSKPITTRYDASQEAIAGTGSSTSLGGIPNPVEELEVKKNPGKEAKIDAAGNASAPEEAPLAVQKAIAAGNKINSLPYVFGGGHGNLEKTYPGYDCSSSTSYLLFKAGVLEGTEALDTEGLANWGESGPGKWITVYTSGGSGDTAHAFIVVAGIMFNSVPPENHYDPPQPESGARWYSGSKVEWSLKNDLGGRPFYARHPKGL